MEPLALVIGALVALSLAFVGAPLVRDEEELEPIRPPLKAASEAADSDDRLADVEYGPLTQHGRVRCCHCGSVSDDSYRYCGQCLTALR